VCKLDRVKAKSLCVNYNPVARSPGMMYIWQVLITTPWLGPRISSIKELSAMENAVFFAIKHD
jgi:hypothetical protein